jgi:hypothetical protein
MMKEGGARISRLGASTEEGIHGKAEKKFSKDAPT